MYNENQPDPAPSNVPETARSAEPSLGRQNIPAERTLNQENTPAVEEIETKPEAFWQNIGEKRPLLKKVYNQIVDWKSVFFILSKNGS